MKKWNEKENKHSDFADGEGHSFVWVIGSDGVQFTQRSNQFVTCEQR